MVAPRLILASRSPRRADMLRGLGLAFEVRTGECAELWRPGESAADFAKRVSVEKLLACPREPGELRLAADTVVWLDAAPAPLGKPRDRDQAAEMLEALQAAGHHRVSTAYALDTGPAPGDPPRVDVVTTRVHFRRLHADELKRYLDSREWSDKAGGYGIQAGAASFVTHIEGSYTNVVGLPLAEVATALRELGLTPALRSKPAKASHVTSAT